MDRDRIVKIAREEIGKHSMDTFVENPPSIAQGGHGVVVSGVQAQKEIPEPQSPRDI